jgi:hypothetical protein
MLSCRTFALWGFFVGMVSCQVSDGNKHHSSISTTTHVLECSKVIDVVVDMKGSYDINAEVANETASPCPYVYWEPSVPGLVSIDTRLRAIGGPPCLPSVEGAARDLCSVSTTSDQVNVSCLDDKGAIHVGGESLANIATSIRTVPACVQIVNRIGQRNLDRRTAEWLANRAACVDKATTRRKIPVYLEVSEAPSSAQCRSGQAILCASLRLSIPAVGFARDLGDIGNYPACVASRIVDPNGIRFDCSDLGLSAANVYTSGNKVFFRTGNERTSDSKRPEDATMQSVDLPCGLEPDFRIRGPAKIQWASEPKKHQ